MNEDYEKGYDRGVLDTVEECQRLQHNWNELKKWLEDWKTNLECEKESVEGLDLFEEHNLIILDDVLTKMQELEDGGNNEIR